MQVSFCIQKRYIFCLKYVNKSKLKTTFKPMIVLDKNRNFYTCACKTNFRCRGVKIQHKQHFPKVQFFFKKDFFNKTLTLLTAIDDCQKN